MSTPVSTPVINLILEPGKPGCRVTVTSHHDQVTQQFGDPQAALEAALLAGAAISLAEEGLAHLQEQARQIMAERSKDDMVKRSPTGSSYLDSAPEGNPELASGGAPDTETLVDTFGELSSGGLAARTDPPKEEEGFVEPGGQLTANDSLALGVDLDFLFSTATNQAAAALAISERSDLDILEQLNRVHALLDNSFVTFHRATCLLPLTENERVRGEMGKMQAIGTQLRSKYESASVADAVKNDDQSKLLLRLIQDTLTLEVFSPKGQCAVSQQETAPACAEASPPAGLPA